MRRTLRRLALVGAAAGAALAVLGYLRNAPATQRGEVQIVLDDGATTVEPEGAQAREFVDIARRMLETGGGP